MVGDSVIKGPFILSSSYIKILLALELQAPMTFVMLNLANPRISSIPSSLRVDVDVDVNIIVIADKSRLVRLHRLR